jgi:hypothetical protein
MLEDGYDEMRKKLSLCSRTSYFFFRATEFVDEAV